MPATIPTQPFNLANGVGVAGRRREDVERSVPAGDIAALLTRFSELGKKAFVQTGTSFPIMVIQEAGLDGF